MDEVFYHEPVLLRETTQYLLEAHKGDSEGTKRVYVDCTLGGGGYTKKILEDSPEETVVIAIDRDVYAIEHCKKVLSEYSSRIIFKQRNFGEIIDIVQSEGFEKIAGIVMDLGLSTFQLSHEAGFSYQKDTALDMRADKSQQLTAADVLNTYGEKDLADILFKYAEMRYSRQIAKEIVEYRKSKKFETTFQLTELLSAKVPPRFLNSDLSRLFQAIRIEVNNELENLERVLEDSPEMMTEGARIVAVSYHSLEDRIVKNAIRSNEKLKVLTKKPVEATEEEISLNVRSRSAKLRAAEKDSNKQGSKNKYKKDI
ncbi:MAG: 16S rRNA (cytosine(1402)-N(4))-methyltransferase RsmH [Ignavibacteria bacterium]|nr:16S rRNA (cytosine(1402)-N(4))-methyltransferase RsmH [Ignavibacteria bacterium]